MNKPHVDTAIDAAEDRPTRAQLAAHWSIQKWSTAQLAAHWQRSMPPTDPAQLANNCSIHKWSPAQLANHWMTAACH